MPGVFRWKTCSKEGTLVILYGLSANALTEKVSENPLKVRKTRQIMAVQDGKCSKQRDYVRYWEYFSEKCLKAPEKCRM